MKRDANFIVNNTSDFAEEEIIFLFPDNVTEVSVKGLHTKHHLGFDIQTAQEINTLKGHVCVTEQDLLDLDYPVRDANDLVAMIGRRVKAYDDRGVLCSYVVAQCYPNEKVGTISIILGAYDDAGAFDDSFDESFQ